MDSQDEQFLTQTLAKFGYDAARYGFRKLVAGKKLWNFDKKDFETWKVAL
jgi:hypothetical protein